MFRKKLKNLILNFTPSKIARMYSEKQVWKYQELTNYLNISYSQEGEDLILKRLFNSKKNGFYIDVGAHHPKRFSNTYVFYNEGWRGINIDPIPEMLENFSRSRPEDINLQIGIANEKKQLVYYVFNEPALNTFSAEMAKTKDGFAGYKIIDKINVQVLKLEEVLKKYLPDNQNIGFLSIDTEGLDYEILKSNDWNKYRPLVVIAEKTKSSVKEIIDSDLYRLMDRNNYDFYAKTVNSVFFIDKENSHQLAL